MVAVRLVSVRDAAAIATHGLTKRYRADVAALDGLELEVGRGEVFGFLGPNGAGKSTTIRLLLDLIRPTAGTASLLGLDTRRDGVPARRRVGYLPGNLRLADRLTGREQLDSLARLRGTTRPELRDMLVERFGVTLDRPIRELSKGNRQKLGVVQAFMHRPDLLILETSSPVVYGSVNRSREMFQTTRPSRGPRTSAIVSEWRAAAAARIQ